MCDGGLTLAKGEYVCVQIFPETKGKGKEMEAGQKTKKSHSEDSE